MGDNKNTMTPPPVEDREKWVAWHRGKIGGHAAAVLMGHLHSRSQKIQTPLDLYDSIVYGGEEEDPATRAFFDWRLAMEAPIAERFSSRTGALIVTTGSSCHDKDPRIISTPDRVIEDFPGTEHRFGGAGILEVKSSDPSIYRRILMEGMPTAFWVQLQHYMMITGSLWGTVVVGNVSTGEQFDVTFGADKEFQSALLRRELDFLDRVDRRDPPTEEEDQVDGLPEFDGDVKSVEGLPDGPEFRDAVDDYFRMKELSEDAAVVLGAAKERLAGFMESHDLDAAEGYGFRVYHRKQAGRKTFNKALLKKAHPEIDVDDPAFYKIGKPSQPLRPYRLKKPKAVEK